MPALQKYFDYAEIAFASYENTLVFGYSVNANKFKEAGMSNSQAIAFDKQWSVLAQTDISDGFSAVLFERVDSAGYPTGEKVLGIRGTETSYGGIDFQTDIVDIALLGTNVGMPQFNSLEAFYQQLVNTGKLGASETFTVSGHSLGGFLTQAFAAKHTNVVQAAYTYNAPGFSVAPGWVTNIGTELLEFFGITNASIPNERIFNVRADGPSATAGLGQMIGYRLHPACHDGAVASSHRQPLDRSVDRLADRKSPAELAQFKHRHGSISALMKAASSRDADRSVASRVAYHANLDALTNSQAAASNKRFL